MAIFRDEAYRLAQIAALAFVPENCEFDNEKAVAWAIDLLGECEERLDEMDPERE